MLENYFVSLKGIIKDKISFLQSSDLRQTQTPFLIEDKDFCEIEFFSGTLKSGDEIKEDEEEIEEEFFNQASQALTSAAQWLNEQDQDLFERLNKSCEMQLLIRVEGYGSQFADTFPSDLNLAMGQKNIPLIYQYDDLDEEMDLLTMNGEMTISLRAYKQDSKILHEDFLGRLQLEDPLIDGIWKSKDSGTPAIIGFQSMKSEFSDQIFFENFSKVALWLDQQNDQLFFDLREKKVKMDIFIGGLLEGDRYRFAFPSNFLLVCGKKGLDINFYIND